MGGGERDCNIIIQSLVRLEGIFGIAGGGAAGGTGERRDYGNRIATSSSLQGNSINRAARRFNEGKFPSNSSSSMMMATTLRRAGSLDRVPISFN